MWRKYGDRMIIRARYDIPLGTGIFIPYCLREVSDEKSVLSKHFVDGCDCDLCKMDKLDGAVKVRQRKQLLTKQHDSLQSLVRSSFKNSRVDPVARRRIEA